VLIAITSCDKEPYLFRQKLQQETWIPIAQQAGYAVEFFTGKRLGVSDDYLKLPLKLRAMCRWATEQNYDYMLKVDDDTYVNVGGLRIIRADYAGVPIPPNDCGDYKNSAPELKPGTTKYPYCPGGAIWLSARAMRFIANALVETDWADDRWAGQVLGKYNIIICSMADKMILGPVNHGMFNPATLRPLLKKEIVAVMQAGAGDRGKDNFVLCQKFFAGAYILR
jgi:hypothetical protein